MATLYAARGDELAQGTVEAVHGAPKALGEAPPPGEAPPLPVGLPCQQCEQPYGTV